ncbi:AIM24 family protein [Dysgonomonas sp. 520]|uniref:AIM24 family protein n=1 Tax=Dysgonomonas sp. 520 TaxID=2302931 RepID=UPI0013CF8F5F|nr:AIM24 family protein [Dysgonomonas sp. 520]NDW10647.1 AIM24 family protein [Dysgonomonas sp. 520]
MNKFSLDAFLKETAQDDSKHGFFELEKPEMLELNLQNQTVMMKAGSMVAYDGDIKFKRESILSQGLGNLLKKAISSEGIKAMEASGTGRIYAADLKKRIRILYLENETIFVNGNDVLAYEKDVKSEIKMMKSVAGMVGGGLFQVKLSGTGHIAITTHGNPLTLRVEPSKPVFADPNATVAWSGTLTHSIKTDVSFKTFLGRGSGESIQMKFEGSGWVLIQPYEESYGTAK